MENIRCYYSRTRLPEKSEILACRYFKIMLENLTALSQSLHCTYLSGKSAREDILIIHGSDE